MNEQIVISYTGFHNPADLAGFVDVLVDTLAEQGSACSIQTQQVSPFAMDGNQFRVVWGGSYSFKSPDGAFHFGRGGQDLHVEVETQVLDFSAMMRLFGGRSRKLTEAYRDTLREIYNLSVNVRSGAVDTGELSQAGYLSETLDSAVNAFPNSN